MSSCEFSSKTNNKSFSVIENSDEFEYFLVKDKDSIRYYWKREYIENPARYKHFYKSKISNENQTEVISYVPYDLEKKYKLLLEEVFDEKNDLILKIENQKIRISLNQVLEIEKIVQKNKETIFIVDTLPSKYLKWRNRVILDSIIFTTPKGHYLCGTAQNEILEKNFPKSNKIEISKVQGEKLIDEIKNKD